MKGIPALIVRLFAILAAYLCATLAASGFLHILVLPVLLTGEGDVPAGLRVASVVSIPLLAVLAARLAFVTSALAILLGETASLRGWPFYALAGAAGALWARQAWVGFDSVSGTPLPVHFLLALVASGIVGGLVYWTVAGRSAGLWRVVRRQ